MVSCSKAKVDPNASVRDITGTVSVYNEFGVSSNDVIGVTVTLSAGTATYSTQTIQGGKFIFKKIPYGLYTLAISKNGYGTNKRFRIQHQRSADSASFPLQLSSIGITQLSSTSVTSFGAQAKPNGAFTYWVSIAPAPTFYTTPRFYRIFLGTDSLVAYNHFDVFVMALGLSTSSAGGTLNSALNPTRYPPGTKIWMKIYGEASPDNMYYDSTMNKWEFPCLNYFTQTATSFVVQ
jgi:hypothetical protein